MNAWYLERTAPWIERIGIETVREILADPATRQALYERFLFSQRFSQDDPWTDRANGSDSHEFTPLTTVG
jgi:nitrite reductase (NADH) large subunit